MATSPFYRVLIGRNGRDITDLITQFSYEDCTDKDDLLKLTLGNISVAQVDDKDFHEGQQLLFHFGYLGGAQSKQHQAIITAVEPSFGSQITLQITASDSGVVMKKNNPTTLHQGKKASDIARDIAKKHGLTAVVEETSKVWKSMPQGGRTDFELLKYLAGHEPGGQFRFMVKGKTLHFTKIDLKKPSRRTFRYNNGDGDVISFRPRSNATNKKAASAETKVPGIDPFSAKPFAGNAKEGETKQDPKLGTFRTHYNADGEEVGRTQTAPAGVSRTIVTPTHDAGSAAAVADKEKKDAALSDVTATLVTVGDPNLLADEIISIDGVGATYGGNWYLKTVTHSFNGNAFYQCTSELGRNATNKAGKADAPKNEDKNTSTGPAKTDSRQPVRIKYDQNSIQVN